MSKPLEKKAARGRTGPGANATRAASITTLQYTAETARRQDFVHISSLVDLAQHEFDTHIEKARQYEALADQHTRQAFRALDNLREYQRLIPSHQEAAA